MDTLDERVPLLERAGRLHLAASENYQKHLALHNEMLREMRQDNHNTQRLWVRLCQKYGWLEDEDLFNA